MTLGVLVLDLDDTLFLESDYVRSGFDAVGQLVAELHGITGFGDHCWRLFEAGHRGRTFDAAADALGVDPDVVQHLVLHYRSHQPRISLAESVASALRDARTRSAGLAVLTDGWPESQRAKIAALGIEHYVDVVVVTDELGGAHLRKPHPAGFEAVMSHWPDLPPEAFTYIGDNVNKDRVGAEAVGWRFLAVRTAGGLYVNQDDATDHEAYDDVVAAIRAWCT